MVDSPPVSAARMFLAELQSRGAHVAQVTYDRVGQNHKELSVAKGEFLEVIKLNLSDKDFHNHRLLLIFRYSMTLKTGGTVETPPVELDLFPRQFCSISTAVKTASPHRHRIPPGRRQIPG